MGIGNFFGSMPAPMQRSKLYGVEIDSISGRIAKQLYQNANIDVYKRQALNTALPIGVRQVETMRTLLTQSLAVLMPDVYKRQIRYWRIKMRISTGYSVRM